MGTKSRESIYGGSIRHSAERAAEARKEADRLACVAWNQRMLGFKGPAQPSPHVNGRTSAKLWGRTLSSRKELVRIFYKEMWDHADKKLIPHDFPSRLTLRGSLGRPASHCVWRSGKLRYESLSPPNKRSMCWGRRDRRQVVDGKIFNSQGVLVGMVIGPEVFNLRGKKLFDLKGVNLYRLSGDLVGHLASAQGAEKHLDKATDKLFPTS